MEIFVNELPKNCEECPLCQHGYAKILYKKRYHEIRGCVLGDYVKYRFIDDEVDTCPLKELPTENKLKELKEWLETEQENRRAKCEKCGFYGELNEYVAQLEYGNEILLNIKELNKGESDD